MGNNFSVCSLGGIIAFILNITVRSLPESCCSKQNGRREKYARPLSNDYDFSACNRSEVAG